MLGFSDTVAPGFSWFKCRLLVQAFVFRVPCLPSGLLSFFPHSYFESFPLLIPAHCTWRKSELQWRPKGDCIQLVGWVGLLDGGGGVGGRRAEITV